VKLNAAWTVNSARRQVAADLILAVDACLDDGPLAVRHVIDEVDLRADVGQVDLVRRVHPRLQLYLTLLLFLATVLSRT